MKVATIIPTYPRDYHLKLRLCLRSFVETGCTNDLYLIFSNVRDYEELMTISKHIWSPLTTPGGDPPFKPIIMQSNKLLNNSTLPNCITYKKFNGVKQLFEMDYDLVGLFDCDIEFVRKLDTELVYKEIYDSKKFKANRSPCNNIVNNDIKALGLWENENIIKENPDRDLYWWFNEICVYEKNHFLEFWDWFTDLPNYYDILKYYKHFDYNLYSVWLIAFKGFTLEKYMLDTIFEGGALECNRGSDCLNTSHTFNSHADGNKNWKDYEKQKVLIHTDRHMEHLKVKDEEMLRRFFTIFTETDEDEEILEENSNEY